MSNTAETAVNITRPVETTQRETPAPVTLDGVEEDVALLFEAEVEDVSSFGVAV